MIFLILLVLGTVLGLGIHTTVRYGDAERPDDISAARWWWNTATETAVMWGCFVRSLPARFRAWREADDAPSAVPAAPLSPVPPPAPLPPVPAPPAAPAAAPGWSAIPRDHAMVHERIATFEPENEADLLAFYAEEATAEFGRGTAWLAHAEMLANGAGLDPACVYVAMLIAEAYSDMTAIFAMAIQRYRQAYALLHEHRNDGGTFPDDPATWFGQAS